MFKKDKDLEQRTSNIIKNKDFKKLKLDILKQFPFDETTGRGVTEDNLTNIFPSKCSITCTKLTSRTLLYSIDLIPYFIDLNGRCDLYPTVFALWKIPVMLPQVVIHSPVSTFVLRGADLMAPGIYKLDNIHKGDKVSIRVRNNPFPFAIGLSEVDTVEEFSSCLTRPKGKAVQVLHSFGDMLWKGAPASIPNNGFLALTVVTAEDQCASSDDDDDGYDEKDSVDDGDDNDDDGDDGDGGNDIDKADDMGGARSIDYDCDELMVENQSTENGVVCIENLSINVDEDNDLTENTCPQAEEGRVHTAETRKIVDELLLLHLLRCLKYLIRDRDLPLLVSSLWGTVKKSISVNEIHPAMPCPDGVDSKTSLRIEPDIRSSSFSKVSKFFEFASASLAVLDLEEVSNGVVAVVNISRQNDLYKTWKSSIAVDDPDSFRLAINNFNSNVENSNGDDSENDGAMRSLPSSSLRVADVLPNVGVGSTMKVVDIFKLTKDVRREFDPFFKNRGSDKEEKYLTGAEVQQLLNQYIQARELENPAAKHELILSPDQFFYRTFLKEQNKLTKKSSQSQQPKGDQRTAKAEKVDHSTHSEPNQGGGYDDIPDSYDDEWDKDPYEDSSISTSRGVVRDEDNDPLSQYTVVAGVIMPSALKTDPKIGLKTGKPGTPKEGESRRSNVPGGWGVATGEKWKPIELPKEVIKPPQNSGPKVNAHTGRTETMANGHHLRSGNPKKPKESFQDPGVPLHVSKESFMKVLKAKLTPYHAIVFPSGECSISAGMPTKVLVEVEMRKGNKVVTKVSGLEVYRFDIGQVARDLQKKFACSTTVTPAPGKVNQKEIVMQGNWSFELEKHLVEHYNIQKRFVEMKVSGKIKPKKR